MKRANKNCIKCGKPFSTCSGVREKCYSCLSKCREKHNFPNQLMNNSVRIKAREAREAKDQ